MEIPVINFDELINYDKRSQTMALLNNACQKWGFFWVENHGIDEELMEKVKHFINSYYSTKLKDAFHKSNVTRAILESKDVKIASNSDWESSFFIWHHPKSNLHEFQDFPHEFCETMDEYITQLIKVAEKLAESMSLNLGLHKDYIKQTFSRGKSSPAVGTKVAKYPECPNPELVRGLREHTDAGGIILLLQDDKVPGLEFQRGNGEWVKIPPTSSNNRIFINIGDQIEVLSNGRYKSIVHRVMTGDSGCRLSVATFYNPAGDAIISPVSELLYPHSYSFQDYLELYSQTKFGDKGARFESMKMKNKAKKIADGHEP